MSARYDGITGLTDVFDRYWAGIMEDHPEAATFLGWHEHHDKLSDLSIDNVERLRGEAGDPLDALHTIDRDSLSDDDQLSYDLFETLVQMDVDAAQFPVEYMPVDQLTGPQSDLPFLLSSMP